MYGISDTVFYISSIYCSNMNKLCYVLSIYYKRGDRLRGVRKRGAWKGGGEGGEVGGERGVGV